MTHACFVAESVMCKGCSYASFDLTCSAVCSADCMFLLWDMSSHHSAGLCQSTGHSNIISLGPRGHPKGCRMRLPGWCMPCPACNGIMTELCNAGL